MSKVQTKKIIYSGGCLGRLLSPLLKTGLPLLNSVIKPLGLLGFTAASSGTTTLVISNEEMNDIMKIVQD